MTESRSPYVSSGCSLCRKRFKQFIGLPRENFPIESLDHPLAGSLPHRFELLAVAEQLDYFAGQWFALLATDDSTGFSWEQRFSGSTRRAGEHWPATGLCFQQHHAESFKVAIYLAIGKRKQIALLITVD